MTEVPQTIGRYRVLREIGRGATAAVYLARHPDQDGPVAIKYVRRRDHAHEQARWWRRILKLFRSEEAVARRLRHPNIIRIHDYVIDYDEAYVVMEYFNGRPLERYCRFDRLLPIQRAAGIVFKCCMALDHAYRQGVVHRDIKPANILIDADDNVKITDFGLALNIGRKVQTDSTFIMGVGSPAYMSPEQIKNYPLDQKTDLYSLGVVLFHLLTGRLPFRADNPAQLIYKILNTEPPSASMLNPQLPATMDAVLARALRKDLYSRYRNGAEFAQDLTAARYSVAEAGPGPAADTRRFARLRCLEFFRGLDDLGVWEVLRISAWRTVAALQPIYREGDACRRFGLVLEGAVELSVDGHRVGQSGPGSLFGELAWLDITHGKQVCTATAQEATFFLEINPAALALASDDLQGFFRERVASVVAQRMGAALRVFAKEKELAVRERAP